MNFAPLIRDLNTKQTKAVATILGCHGVPPYVIYGPPGTGKTMTVVEAILQVAKRTTNILVCAASNAAADLILKKLVQHNTCRPCDVLKLNGPSCQYEDVDHDLIQYCFVAYRKFKCPLFRKLRQYKIVISTYTSSYLLQDKRIPQEHFTHNFLDDAGEVSEPETMIPLSGLCTRDTVVALAGDPMLLGPVVYCKEAEKDGLGIPYLQRLLDSEPYRTGKSDYVTKLMMNYQCHPAILVLASKLFYSGELIAHKDDKVPLIYDCIGLPNKLFPVLFVGVQGCNEMESSAPSWFNAIEVSKVVSLIRKLESGGDVREADIGVIAPFPQQVYKIKEALKELDMTDLKVGNVEQFVGEEREVMIISTVRTTVKLNEFDNFFKLGILNNHKGFNVVISRAKSLLIIVGNPYIITKDWHWCRLLKHCIENGSYQGCPLPLPDNGSYQGSTRR